MEWLLPERRAFYRGREDPSNADPCARDHERGFERERVHESGTSRTPPQAMARRNATRPRFQREAPRRATPGVHRLCPPRHVARTTCKHKRRANGKCGTMLRLALAMRSLPRHSMQSQAPPAMQNRYVGKTVAMAATFPPHVGICGFCMARPLHMKLLFAGVPQLRARGTVCAGPNRPLAPTTKRRTADFARIAAMGKGLSASSPRHCFTMHSAERGKLARG